MEERIACVIIDDEPLGQELLRKYVGRLGYLDLVAVYDNALQALEGATGSRPQLLFLDVNMPEMTGLEYLNTFNGLKPHVILTTAYSEYAVQGFDHDVADFLLKPITFDRFVKAVHKVKEKIAYAQHLQVEKPIVPLSASTADKPMLLIKENKKFLNVPQDQVLLVEGMKDYLKVHTTGKVIITHMTMTKMEELLSSDFLRVNRSYIIRKSAIKVIQGNNIEMINQVQVPIGTRYRESIRELTEGRML
ncbi:LytR/AlgR family response regulator transcription factor [Rufibacter latericius]|uniref:DNA-binding response regulator n=1 Tax=Rufibacter latericius TaxID=2487040 RepID=A0A3M9ME35_9BACT|nr:response regulator transcription factor [Rufibacter latericius]RNI23397.1 DNA-binding response regulator [Rufibacter latericius]